MSLDISKWREVTNEDAYDNAEAVVEDYNRLHTEALRAQASEDALRERVRVLECEVIASALLNQSVAEQFVASAERVRVLGEAMNCAMCYLEVYDRAHKILDKALGGGKESEG